ncbi:MAG: trypsin-like peptidase domain-containing protein, partial [bacterium]|nr:trypsin-like peptidase domain-containing protein [bacterium]
MRKKNSIVTLTRIVVVTLCIYLSAAGALYAQDAQPTDKSESAKTLIVKVDGKNEFGAGIIFSVRGGYLFIATAYHVVRGSGNDEIRVEFEFLRGVPIEAEVIHSYSKLDLAILRVHIRSTQLQELRVRLPFDRIRRVDKLRRGDAVYPVGHPEGEDWDVPIAASQVKKAIAEEIHFQPACLPGNSGGGLFSEQWDLVGMVIRARASSCEAVSFERIRATLEEDWELEVDRDAVELDPAEIPATPTPTPISTPTPSTSEIDRQKITRLLQTADAYFARKWYTTPAETNAFDIYLEVLKLDSTNAHAFQQIDTIAQFYKSRAERELKRGREQQAIENYQKYLS